MSRKRRTDSPNKARARARKRALQALYQWEITGHDPDDIIAQFCEEQDMSRVDVAYFEELVRGVLTDSEALDALIGQHADRTLERIDLMEKSVLRLGARELTNHLEIPFRVVIDEAVGLAGLFGTEQSPSYVNAVLDRLAQECRALERAAVR